MSAGKKKRVSQYMDGVSIQDAFGIPAATMENVANISWLSGNNTDKVELDYIGTDAITEADFIGLPIHSKINDYQDNTLKTKTTAPGTATFMECPLNS
jgi:hypothetical protein